MDKASDFESEDCEFESRHGQNIEFFILYVDKCVEFNKTATFIEMYIISKPLVFSNNLIIL